MAFRASSLIPVGLLCSVSPAFAQSGHIEDVSCMGASLTDPQSLASRQTPSTEPKWVTGSMLPDEDSISIGPLVRIEDEDFRLSGAFNPDFLIRTLPMENGSLGAFVNNGGDGTARTALRGLGGLRTLTLVNGRRWIPVDVGGNVDVNTIPAFRIESVEISTGGGSAVYGSGAIAGVVNFRLGRINGLSAGARAGISEEGDARRLGGHLAFGTDFADGRGHFATYAEYFDRRPILAGGRAYSQFELADGLDGTLAPTGSASVPEGRFTAPAGTGRGTNYSTSAGALGAFFATPGTSRPFDPGDEIVFGDFYNYNPPNYLLVPQERWSLGAEAEYALSPSARAYAEFQFSNNRTAVQMAPALFNANFGGLIEYDLAAVAPLLSPADRSQLALISARQGRLGVPPGVALLALSYRLEQLGLRRQVHDRDAWRAMAGITGDLGALTWDVHYSRAETRDSRRDTGEARVSSFVTLLGNGGCNAFGAGQLSQACLDAISLTLDSRERSTLEIAQASLGGPIAILPWASDAATFRIGAEWRSARDLYELDENLPDSTSSQPTGGRGRHHVKEVFGEFRLPLVQDGLVHRLELDGGLRLSRYSFPGVRTAFSWFAGAEFAPIPDLVLRGQYQRSINAPSNVIQYAFDQSYLDFIADPCEAGAERQDEGVRRTCVATGVPQDSVFNFSPDPFAEIRLRNNPGQEEERADIWTLGAVLRPRFLPGVTLSIDYYDIAVDRIATRLDQFELLDACYYRAQDADDPTCRAITRDATGQILSADLLTRNIGRRETSGIDVQLDYVQPLAWSLTGAGNSRLALQLLANWTNEVRPERTPGADRYALQCDGGRFNCAELFILPRWSWTSRLSWIDGPVTTSLRWRHTGAVRDANDAVDYTVERIGAYDLVDLSVAFRIDEHFKLALGVNNLFDRKPPLLGSNHEFGASNSYASEYDIVGRDFFLSVDWQW